MLVGWINEQQNEFLSEPEKCFYQCKCKAPASSGHTCWKNWGLSAPGKSGQEEASPEHGESREFLSSFSCPHFHCGPKNPDQASKQQEQDIKETFFALAVEKFPGKLAFSLHHGPINMVGTSLSSEIRKPQI